MPTNILLVDDHAIVRKGILLLLEDDDDLEVIGEAENGEQAIVLTRELSPDVIIMDISMSGINGIEATRQISKEFPETKILALSIHSEKHYVQDMLQSGADGYILKESVPEDLIRGIHAVINGEGYLSPSITGIVVSGFRDKLSYQHYESKTDNNILLTKLHQPTISNKHVHRIRLIQSLDSNRNLPLQLIIAPAGYGKTTLISCWLKHNDWPSIWLSIDKMDNDLHQFLRYLTHAIQKQFPDSLSKFNLLINLPKLPSNEVLTNNLINEIEDIGQDFIFVLDDFHLIKENLIHDLLSSILRYPPQNLHLIIIGRKPPFFPLHTLRVQEKCHEIHMIDLKFNEQETRKYLQRSFDKKIDMESLTYWTEKTEGWITALQLTVLAKNQQPTLITNFEEKHIDTQYIMEYLFSEVVAQVDPKIYQFLLCTSISNRFCVPLCIAICPTETGSMQNSCLSSNIIDYLKNENLFLIDLDGQNFWFRYHHLFQDLLYDRLRNEFSLEHRVSLHDKASRWFEKNNFIEDAIYHRIKARDPEGAAKILEKNQVYEQDNDRWRNVQRWLNLLPAEIKYHHPHLLLTQAWIYHDLFQLNKISEIINKMESLGTEITFDDTSIREMNFFKAILLYWEGKADASLKLLSSIKNSRSKMQHRFDGICEQYYCVASHFVGQGKTALESINNLLLTKPSLNDVILSRTLMARAFINMLSGHLTLVTQDAQSVMEISDNKARVKSWGNYLQASRAFFSNHLEIAISHFKSILDDRYNILTRVVIDAFSGLALCYQLMNRPDTAKEFVEQLIDFTLEINDPQFQILAHSLQARIAVAQDDLEPASLWLKEFNQTSFNPDMFIWIEVPTITQARVLITISSDESLEQACQLLETFIQTVEASHNTFQKIIVLPLLAITYSKQGHVNKSIEVTKEAVKLSRTGDWIQPFIESGSAMCELINNLMLQDETLTTEELNYIKKILTAFIVKEPVTKSETSSFADKSLSSTPSVSMDNLLTNREIEILMLLKQRFSNKEIGEQLFISMETVKSHLKKIYTKFDVGDRKEAVNKADELGFFD